MLTLNDGRAELWQWDTGRTLAVDADCSQVHFSNKVFGRSFDVDVVDGTAIIPDVLLQTDKDLNVWAFVGTAENGYTKISKTFKVNRRNKPADYVFTPSEQTTIAELLERIHDDLQEATNEALAQAKASGEFDGADGKSAYAYAVEGGYTGTEAEFAEKLASGALIVTITESNGTLSANKTFSEIVDAIYAGTTVLASYNYMILTLIGITGYAMYFGIIHCDNDGTDAMAATVVIEIADNDGVNDISADVEIPKTLPNPNALTFTGAVNGSYDGSEALTVEIPSKLGQFENDVGYLTLGTLPIYDGSVINGGEIV